MMRWGHALEANPERWIGSFLSKDEAIDDGLDTYLDGFYVCGGEVASGADYVPSAEDIETQIWQAAYDDVGDAAEKFPDLSEEAREELRRFLNRWTDQHVRPRFWVPNKKTIQQINPNQLGLTLP